MESGGARAERVPPTAHLLVVLLLVVLLMQKRSGGEERGQVTRGQSAPSPAKERPLAWSPPATRAFFAGRPASSSSSSSSYSSSC